MGDHVSELWGELSSSSISWWSTAFWAGLSTRLSSWRLASVILSPLSLVLAAIDMKSVAVNRNSRYGHSMWAQRPWQEIMYTTGSDMTASLPRSLGIRFYATNRGSCTNVGMPPTREKGSHLPPRTTKLCNLRNGHDSVTAPLLTRSGTLFLVWRMLLCRAHPGMPEMWWYFHI